MMRSGNQSDRQDPAGQLKSGGSNVSDLKLESSSVSCWASSSSNPTVDVSPPAWAMHSRKSYALGSQFPEQDTYRRSMNQVVFLHMMRPGGKMFLRKANLRWMKAKLTQRAS